MRLDFDRRHLLRLIAAPDNRAHGRRRFERDYLFFAALFAVIMVLTNIIGTKLFVLFPEWLPNGFGWLTDNGPVILTTGIITYPLTFLFTDVVSEVYGRARANYMVLLGFFASVLMLGVIRLGVGLPPADRWWSDASGNLHPSAELIAYDHEDARLRIDVPDAFAEQGGRLALQDADGVWHVHRYQARTSLADGVGAKGYAHHQVQLAKPLGFAPAPGSAVFPVVALTNSAALRVDGAVESRIDAPSLLPTQGLVVLPASGEALRFTRINQQGGIELTLQEGQASVTLAPEQALILQHRYGMAAMQAAYEATFASPGILLFSSMFAYLVAQLLDVSLFHFWRRVTHGRHLWLRNNGSTLISQLVDTAIVNGIFLTLAFGMEPTDVFKVIVCVYICKAVLAAIDTPLIYLGVYLGKRRLGYAMHEEVPDLLQHDGTRADD